MSDRMLVTMDTGVADVRLNRPEKLNALDPAMFEGLVRTGQTLAGDRSVRAVVLSGEGRAFCAGLDFASFMGPREADQPPPNLLAHEAGTVANYAQRAAYVWTDMPVPVIAAVHGVAFGGGLQIALAADMRFVAADAKLSVMEIKWGLIPDMTGSQTLRHLVRLDVAKELTFTGRIISGTEAAALGLATRVSGDPRKDALVLAREIAHQSPDAIRAGKRVLNSAGRSTLAEGLRLEASLQASLIGRPNQVEAVRANLERRTPRFTDPS
ncbi:MAG: crotonase/enoyl-CoA hydratase family protein [Candidatus Binatia bacterium]